MIIVNLLAVLSSERTNYETCGNTVCYENKIKQIIVQVQDRGLEVDQTPLDHTVKGGGGSTYIAYYINSVQVLASRIG